MAETKKVEPQDQKQEMPDSVFEIKIVVTEDGNTGYEVDSKTDEAPRLLEVIGALEFVKMDVAIISKQQSERQAAPAESPVNMELVEIELVQADFDRDPEGFLKKDGKKVGDKIKIPKILADEREKILNGDKEPVIVPVKGADA